MARLPKVDDDVFEIEREMEMDEWNNGRAQKESNGLAANESSVYVNDRVVVCKQGRTGVAMGLIGFGLASWGGEIAVEGGRLRGWTAEMGTAWSR